ncbi:hypothetical protein NRB20_63020 [Nocardia sp. RB20]|uniref:Uncharacterized protein n=1 Tax=Nocardia macrotermitis TaxID=2585198 RepID=A0A7K0DBL0_9NOCA|nr:hypothetical protein [Nocardia macrotermitis]
MVPARITRASSRSAWVRCWEVTPGPNSTQAWKATVRRASIGSAGSFPYQSRRRVISMMYSARRTVGCFQESSSGRISTAYGIRANGSFLSRANGIPPRSGALSGSSSGWINSPSRTTKCSVSGGRIHLYPRRSACASASSQLTLSTVSR